MAAPTVDTSTASSISGSSGSQAAAAGGAGAASETKAKTLSEKHAAKKLEKKKEKAQEKIESMEHFADYRNHRTLVPFTNGDEEALPAKLQVIVRNLEISEEGGPPAASNLDVIPPHTNFFLQSAEESDIEKIHIVESFGEVVWAHMFGRKPRIWTFSGLLINSKNENWVNEWDYLYNRFLRGTKCAELGSQLKLTYDGKVIYGFMVGTGRNFNAVSPHAVPFNFSILVSHVELIRVDSIIEALTAGGVTSKVNAEGVVENDEYTLEKATDLAKEAVAGSDAAVGAQIEELLGGS